MQMQPDYSIPANIIDLWLLAFRYMHVAEAKRSLSQWMKVAVMGENWWLNERTLLHYSCSHGWLDVTKRLVENYSCDPGISRNEGETPLHEACREGHTDVVMYLVLEIGVSAICFNKEERVSKRVDY